jgi:hypothetical protein
METPAFATPPPSGTPSGIQIDPALAAAGGQRSMQTIEVQADQVPALLAAQQKPPSTGKMAVLFVMAALMMLGVGVGATFVLLGGGDPVGTVEIRTVPPVAATVTIDGEPRGESPLRVDNIPAGDHIIEFEAAGFGATERRVHIESGTVAMLEVALVRETATPSDIGSVAVAPTEDPSTDVAAAPDPAPEATPEPAPEPAPERERAEATPDRTPTEDRPRMTTRAATMDTEETPRMGPVRINMNTAEATMMNPDMAAASGFGTLIINSLPWARVFIDGRDTQRNTPVRSLRVRAGTRRVGLRTPDEEMHTFTVDVPAGETIRVSKRL